jgi:hypothetical protein
MIVRMRGMGGCGCGCNGMTPGSGGCGMGQTPADIWTGAQAILTPAAWSGVIQSGNPLLIAGLIGVPILGLLLFGGFFGKR